MELPINPKDILMERGATRYVAEEYLSDGLWDKEQSVTDNIALFDKYLHNMNVTL